MKLKTLLLTTMAALGLSVSSCSSLGFGVDVDSGGVSPYFYGNNYFGPLSVGASWNGGPIGGPLWGPPPILGYGPGSLGVVQRPILRPQPTRPQQPVRPPQQQQPNRPQQSFRPAQNFGPSQSQPPMEVGPDLRPINNGSAPANRPGNYGLPN